MHFRSVIAYIQSKGIAKPLLLVKCMKSSLASFQRVPYLMPLNFRHSLSLIIKLLFIVLSRKYPVFIFRAKLNTQKEITSQTDLYLLNLSSKTYVFEEKLTKY